MYCNLWNVIYLLISFRIFRTTIVSLSRLYFATLTRDLVSLHQNKSCFEHINVVCSDLGGTIRCIQRQMMEPGIVCIDIRREFVLEDALQEVRKKRFSPKR